MVLIGVIVIRVGPHARHIRLTMSQRASPHSDKDLVFRKRETVGGGGRTEGFCAYVLHFSPSKHQTLMLLNLQSDAQKAWEGLWHMQQ